MGEQENFGSENHTPAEEGSMRDDQARGYRELAWPDELAEQDEAEVGTQRPADGDLLRAAQPPKQPTEEAATVEPQATAAPSGRPPQPWDKERAGSAYKELGSQDPPSPELIEAARRQREARPAAEPPRPPSAEAKAELEAARQKIIDSTGMTPAEQRAYEARRERDRLAGPGDPEPR